MRPRICSCRSAALGHGVTARAYVDLATALERAIPRDSAAFGGADATREAYELRYHAACRRYAAEVDPHALADVVVDNRDLQAPVLRRLGPR